MLEELFNYAKDKEWICKSQGKFIHWLAYMSDTSRAKPILSCIKELKLQNPYVLDLGSGFGTITKKLSENYKNVFASEGEFERVNLSKRITPDLKIVQSNICRIPFKKGAFDAVVMNDVLEYNHPNKHAIILKEIHRVLKEGGWLYLRTFNKLEIFDSIHEELIFSSWLPAFLRRIYVNLYKKSKFTVTYKRTSLSLALSLKRNGFMLPTNIFLFTLKNLFRRYFCLFLAKDG